MSPLHTCFLSSNFLELKWEKISGTERRKDGTVTESTSHNQSMQEMHEMFPIPHMFGFKRYHPVRVFKNLSTTDVNLGRFYAYQGQV